jgi:acyl-CoA thioester hydrolase
MNYEYRIDLSVRAHECDIGGVVNNAVYLQYLEHAKYEMLKTMDINYRHLTGLGQSFVLSKLNIDFKFSLKCDDDFWVGTNARRPSNYHLEGEQDIYRSDGKTILLSRVVVVCMQGQEISKLPQPIIEKYPLINHAASPV